MHFDELEKYLKDIAENEFRERNVEIQRCVLSIKSEMNSRGLLKSSITLQKLSEFFEAEFQARCDFIADFVINHLRRVDLSTLSDFVTKAKCLYQELAARENNNIQKMYTSSATTIEKTLLNSSFASQYKAAMLSGIETRIKKNNLHVELECKTLLYATQKGEPVFLLTPSIQGVGINLRELWQRILKT